MKAIFLAAVLALPAASVAEPLSEALAADCKVHIAIWGSDLARPEIEDAFNTVFRVYLMFEDTLEIDIPYFAVCESASTDLTVEEALIEALKRSTPWEDDASN